MGLTTDEKNYLTQVSSIQQRFAQLQAKVRSVLTDDIYVDPLDVKVYRHEYGSRNGISTIFIYYQEFDVTCEPSDLSLETLSLIETEALKAKLHNEKIDIYHKQIKEFLFELCKIKDDLRKSYSEANKRCRYQFLKSGNFKRDVLGQILNQNDITTLKREIQQRQLILENAPYISTDKMSEERLKVDSVIRELDAQINNKSIVKNKF